MAETIQAAGFTSFATGPVREGVPQRLPLPEPDPERDEWELRENFARQGATRHAEAIFALGCEWKPDVLVCDEVDFGSMIAAERLGIPHASVLVLAAGSFLRKEIVAEPLSRLRAEHGLPDDPGLTMLSRHLVLSPFPLSFRHPDFPLPSTAHSFRPPAVPPKPATRPGASTWASDRCSTRCRPLRRPYGRRCPKYSPIPVTAAPPRPSNARSKRFPSQGTRSRFSSRWCREFFSSTASPWPRPRAVLARIRLARRPPALWGRAGSGRSPPATLHPA
jgi:hypothetical protein